MSELTEQEEAVLSYRRKQLDEIRCIFDDKKTLTDGELREKYDDFIKKYPNTWKSIINNDITLGSLERNIDVYEHMFRKSKARGYKEKKFSTDVKFGEKLAEEYLYPTTGKPNTKTMDKALKKARNNLDNQTEVVDKSKLKPLDFD